MKAINQPESEPGLQFMLGYYGRPDTSALVQLLEVGGQKLGHSYYWLKGGTDFRRNMPGCFRFSKSLRYRSFQHPQTS